MPLIAAGAEAHSALTLGGQAEEDTLAGRGTQSQSIQNLGMEYGKRMHGERTGWEQVEWAGGGVQKCRRWWWGERTTLMERRG